MFPETLLNQVILTAKTAGAFIRHERENFNYSQVEIKGLNDLVSYVDKTAEENFKVVLRKPALSLKKTPDPKKKNTTGLSIHWMALLILSMAFPVML